MAQQHRTPDRNIDQTGKRAEDYARNMFADGENRTELNPKSRVAPDYDRAAHSGEADTLQSEERYIASQRNALGHPNSNASGLYDEEDGPIGGTEKELDDLEAAGTPVDRSTRAKTR